MVSVGVRMVIAGVWSLVSANISVVLHGVVPQFGVCCGVDAGFVDIVVGVERVQDGPLTKPSERESSSWSKTKQSGSRQKFSRATYCRLNSTNPSTYPSGYPNTGPSIVEMFYPP